MKTLTSCWVFASAGSGKTKILVDRIIRFLLADVSPNKILCLTFTKTGAAEMQQRINARLAELVLASDEELKKKLRELGEENKISKARALFAKILDSDDRLKIQTIHSFCQGLIKIFPFESGVKPAFEILEENQSKLLLGQAQKLVLRDALRDEKLGKLVAELNAKLDEEGLSELVAELVEHHQETDTQDLISTTNLFQNFLSKLDYKENIKLAAELAVSGSTKNQESAEKIKKFFRDPSLKNFFTYQSAFFTNENEPRKIYGKNSAELENITRKQSALILEFSEELNSATINNDTALLLSFTNKITTKYRELKNQRALLDYNDLIATSNKLLTNPNFADWVKMKMDGSFDHILIDESQDTNHQQWSIIKALTEDFFSGLSAANKQRSIFVVGDEKQSIFSFQGSDPNISNEIFSYFQNRFGSEFKKVELHDSFRSTADVLAAVDKVFLDPERRVAITKNEAEVKHQATRAGQGLVEIWPKAENPEILAQKIASWIQEKSLRYGDVMVLLRNRTNGLFEALIKNFHRYQIPFTSIARIKFSESLLIQDLLAAAKFVLLPQDDLNLACLLKSPIFDFSEEDLLNICVKKNTDKTSIYKALEGSKTRESLDELITKSQQLNCFEFFYFLLHGQNNQQNFLAYFGHESLETLDRFLSLVFHFNKNSAPNLQKFLEFVEKTDPEISLSATEPNRVRISTIHGAKGLQAPIILMPDCAYNLNRSPQEKILWHGEEPIWCAKRSLENHLVKDLRQAKSQEIFAESLRLLYVGMTRAENELYVGGFGSSNDPKSWYEILRSSLPEKVISSERFFEVTESRKQKDKAESEEEKIINIKKYEKPITTSAIETQDLRKTAFAKKFLFLFGCEERKRIKTYVRTAADEKNKNFEAKGRFCASLENKGQIKGRVTHKILEIFGKNFAKDKKTLLHFANQILLREEKLNEKEKNEVRDLAAKFLDSEQFEKIFNGEVRCEVEVVGAGILGRIDLLIEREDEVLIIDYKSDETVPDVVPQQYLNQLATYKKLIAPLYPNKKISTAILWLNDLVGGTKE